MSQVEKINEQVKFLQENEVMITHAEEIGGGKLSVIFRQKKSSGGINLLSLANASDTRFNQGGVRLARMTFEPTDFQKLFNVDLSKMKKEEISYQNGKKVTAIVLGIKNPTINVGDKAYSIILTRFETLAPRSEWDRLNPTKSVKQDGKGNYFFVSSTDEVTGEIIDQPIYGYTDVHVNDGTHTDVTIKETVRKPQFVKDFVVEGQPELVM
jgi:hypothetical protein